jgi:serine phosphatase RsbU (regulator of sigma subunit)
MNTQGLPFGILPFFRADPPAQLRLDSGDLVVLPTDGFFEWENAEGEQFGVQRMEAVIRASRQLPSRNNYATLRCSHKICQRDQATG